MNGRAIVGSDGRIANPIRRVARPNVSVQRRTDTGLRSGSATGPLLLHSMRREVGKAEDARASVTTRSGGPLHGSRLFLNSHPCLKQRSRLLLSLLRRRDTYGYAHDMSRELPKVLQSLLRRCWQQVLKRLCKEHDEQYLG